MFKPKHLLHISNCVFHKTTAIAYNRAMLTRILSAGKLFRTFPCVFDPKDKNPARPIARHMHKETMVEKCVTLAKRSIVGFFRDP